MNAKLLPQRLTDIPSYRVAWSANCSGRVLSIHRGFTIVELIVTISLVGLLPAILLPAVQNAPAASRNVEC